MNRREICDRVIADLHVLENTTQNKYALEENIAFFSAVKQGVFSYFSWFLHRGKNLDGSRLLELTDYPLHVWDEKMHQTLIAQERKKFPGLIEPIVVKIVAFIRMENRPLILANFGSGAMEIERQVLERLEIVKHSKQVIFVGFDKSLMAKRIAKENLGTRTVVEDVGTLDAAVLKEKVAHGKNMVLFAENDIFTLSDTFGRYSFDAVYHSLFRHHLSIVEKKKLDDILPRLSKTIFEYDGFRSLIQMIPQTIVGWNDPVFLNAEIFSNLRYENKRKILERSVGNKVQFTPIGNYLLEFQHKE